MARVIHKYLLKCGNDGIISISHIQTFERGLKMNTSKILVVATAIAMLGGIGASLAADAPKGTPPVVCVMGVFRAPAGVQPTRWNSDDKILTPINGIPDKEYAMIKKCYQKLGWVGNEFHLPFPLLVENGPAKRRVQVTLCVSKGGYRFQGVLAPKKDFVVTFSEKDFLPGQKC
jgi:hypothetical protein